MGNKQSLKTKKRLSRLPSNSLPSKPPKFINTNGSFSHQSNDTPMSTANVQSFTPIATIQPITFPTLSNIEHNNLKLISIASRTSFSTRNRLSIVCPNDTNSNQTLNINNGVTGKYLSYRIAEIATDFWNENIEHMSVADKLEIGAAIFFAMLSTNKEMKAIMQSNLKDNINMKSTSIKYLDMIGWLFRNLLRNDINLYLSLTQLSKIHTAMGINIKHFDPMLEAMHETFGYYFPNKYNIQIKYAFDEIFQITAQIITAQNIKCCSYLNDIAITFNTNDIPFLKSLKVCLKSAVGKKYLYRYLTETWCEELAIFLNSLQQFKNQTSAKSRFIIARNINKTSIEPRSNLSINISYQCRKNILKEMNKLEQRFVAKQELFMSSDFFNICEAEVNKLIRENHWTSFVDNIRQLQLNSLE